MSRGIVTRTIRTLTVTGVFADLSAGSLVTKTVIVPYKKPTKTVVEKQVRRYLKDDNLTLVSVESWEVTRTLYGCTEVMFMQFAEPYDYITRKPVEKEN